MHLFNYGLYQLSSGARSNFKIDCDALTEHDLESLAFIASQSLSPFKTVIGVPTGGLRFAKALVKYSHSAGQALLVDDVLTTGASMNKLKENHPDALGCVIFARGQCPDWITPIFTLTI